MITAILLAATPVAANCEQEREAISIMADAIEERYVLEKTAHKSAKGLREENRRGVFDRHCNDPVAFAEYMTEYLRTEMKDGHLYVEYAPNSDEHGDDDWMEKWREEAASRNHGVKAVKRLKDNIAYLHISDFYEYDPAKKALTAAFELVSNSDALILDLRGNPGGTPETEWPVQWTFMNAGSITPLRKEKRSGAEPDTPEPILDWPRYGTKRPMVILVDKTTFSAPEAVAYSLQAQGRAIVMGSPSGGGAHMLGEGIALPGGWKINVPETRPYSPHTGGNWEGTGVVPDIETSKEDAITAAQKWLVDRLK